MVAEIIHADGQLGILRQRLIIPAAELFDNAPPDREVRSRDGGDFEPFPSAALRHPLKADGFYIDKLRQDRFGRIDDTEFPDNRSRFLIIHQTENQVVHRHFSGVLSASYTQITSPFDSANPEFSAEDFPFPAFGGFVMTILMKSY